MWCNASVCSLPSRFYDVANDSNFLLTWLQCWPFFTGNPDILKGDVAIRQQEAQWLAKGLHVEVEHFVFRHYCQFFPGISRKFSFLISWINFSLSTLFKFLSTFINFKSQILLHRSILAITTQLKKLTKKRDKTTFCSFSQLGRESKADWSGWAVDLPQIDVCLRLDLSKSEARSAADEDRIVNDKRCSHSNNSSVWNCSAVMDWIYFWIRITNLQFICCTKWKLMK